jgi:hypothetical protein
MPRRASNKQRNPQEINLASRDDASVEILVRRGEIEIRKPSDPRAPVLRLTPPEWNAFLRDIKSFGPDLIGDGTALPIELVHGGGQMFDGSAKRRRENKGSNGIGGQQGGTRPPRNFYELLYWLIIYATVNGEPHRRLRVFIFTIVLLLMCMIALLIGAWVAVGTGMPRLITCSISAGGTVLFTLVAALVSKLRGQKTVDQNSP